MIRALLVSMALAPACGNGDARPVQVQLINRGSCSPTTYDLSCMRSLRVQMFDDERAYRSKCTTVGFETWQQLVGSKDFQSVLNEVRARKDVRIEVRGFHNKIENTPCDPDLDDRSLVLWGTSDVVDLTSVKTANVVIYVECRPYCDCNFMGQTCAVELERGVCAPLVRRTCERQCGTADDCFGGLLECQAGFCEPDARGVCWPCESSGDCDSELCVHHTYDYLDYHVDEKACADAARCPPLDGYAYSCPEGMSCARLGDGFFELLP